MRCEKQLSVWAILLVIAVFRPPTVSAEYATIRGTPVSQGQMRIAADDIEAIRAATPQANAQFILKETRVDVEISGVVARVRVDHVFENPYDQRLEAIYVFLKNKDAVADKDFVVEYRLAGEDTVLAALTHCDESGGYFALVLQPKWQIETAELAAREVILLLDRSGSMRGPSIGQLRIFAGHVLNRLNPQDTFRIIAFSNSVQQFQTTALPATPANVAQGQQTIRQLRAGGGRR